MIIPGQNEGDTCGEDGCDGVLELPAVEGCNCHINPPCSACVNNMPRCPLCKRDVERACEPTPKYVPLPLVGLSRRNGEYDMGNGRRLYNVRMNSDSGSTMEYHGYIEGQVTAKEIFERLGDGSFGHRGPFIIGDRFEYTKLTD